MPSFSDAPAPRRIGLAWGATLAWLAVSAAATVALMTGEGFDPVRAMALPVIVLGPIGLIWIAATLLRRIEELARALERSPAPAAEGAGGAAATRTKIDTILAGQQEIRAALSRLSAPPPAPPPTRSPAPARVVAPAEGPAPSIGLDLNERAEPPPLSLAELVTALQFPADPDDVAGFRALRAALRDHQGRQIVTAAQDALTLLSQDGLYMDDFAPERAPPEVWRRFARGERGPAVDAVGGIRDADALARIVRRLREDTVFRDTSHHFIRLFDLLLARLEPGLSDAELAVLTETRTARAFMLLGRARGTFD